MSLITREIIDKINKPMDLVFRVISREKFDSMKIKAAMLGIIIYTQDDLLVIQMKDIKNLDINERDKEKIIVYSFETIHLDNTMFYDDKLSKGLFQETVFTSIDFHNVDTSITTSMRNMFLGCQAEKLDVSEFNTSNVTDMAAMFYGCKLSSLGLSGFDTSNVKNMNRMFGDCIINDLDLSMFCTSKVIKMSYMFWRCQAEKMDLSNFELSSAEYLDSIFEGCKAFENNKVILSDDLKNIISIKVIGDFYDTLSHNKIYCVKTEEQLVEVIISITKEFVGLFNNLTYAYEEGMEDLVGDINRFIDYRYILECINVNGTCILEDGDFIKKYQIIKKVKSRIACA